MYKKLIILVLAAMAVYACTKNETALTKNDAPVSTKAYAQQITNAFQASGTAVTYGHYYGKIIMNELTNTDGAKNILVFNALDGDGQIHIIFKATDKSGKIIDQVHAVEAGTGFPPTSASHVDPISNGRVAYLGGKLDDGIAQQWATSFKTNFTARPSVFTFDVNEFKKILETEGAEGMFFAYGLDNGKERLVAGAINSKADFLWDGYLSISQGERTSKIYPVKRTFKKN